MRWRDMGEAMMAILLVLAILAVATVAFWIWLFVIILRLMGRAFHAIFGPFFLPAPTPADPMDPISCPRPRCRAPNSPGARFCRRCGQELRHPVRTRQAALW